MASSRILCCAQVPSLSGSRSSHPDSSGRSRARSLVSAAYNSGDEIWLSQRESCPVSERHHFLLCLPHT